MEGGVWRAVGQGGAALGSFNQPRGITGFADGSFVVVDRSARVQVFDPSGRPQKLWTIRPDGFGISPKGVAALPDGHLLFCDTHFSCLLEMTIEGKLVRTWGGPGTGPGRFVHPLACAVDRKGGWVYVAEFGGYNDRIQKFGLDGQVRAVWGGFGTAPGQMRRPSGVTVNPAGQVAVADAVNHRIQVFAPDGKLLRIFGEEGRQEGQLRYPYDIACGPEGHWYVAEYNNHRVSVFDGQGGLVRILGGAGTALGAFHWPWSLTVDPLGRLLVSDTGNHRIQILPLTRPWAGGGAPTGGRALGKG
jgi:DNA-binding beta-propeller fold protein YncE